MQERLHYGEGVETRGDIIQHDAGTFRQLFQLAHRRRLDDIEPTKKYKAGEQRLPRHGDGDQRDKLPGNFVDHDELRIFASMGSGYARGRRNTNKDGQYRQGNRQPGLRCGRNPV